MNDRTSVTVRIAGEEHTIRSNAPAEYTIRCADLVGQRIQDIRDRSGMLETHRSAILAALSLADELFQVQEESGGRQGELSNKLKALTDRIDAALD